jgi:hypothetical protein
MVSYRVFLDAHTAVPVQARKLNTGEQWLWFFDDDNRLVALFRWENILGLTTEDAEGQILTDRVPVEMGTIPPEEYSDRLRLHIKDQERHQKESEEREAKLRQDG